MKTKQRILITSLELFNELGEPNVTTVDISNEMEISPGNLYYHYRNKDDIIEHIINDYEQQINQIVQIKQELTGLVEYWLYLKVIVNKNWEYRFIFRDYENIVTKYKHLERKLFRINSKITKVMNSLIIALVDEEQYDIQSFAYKDALADNMALLLTRIPLQHQNSHSSTQNVPSELLTHTCFQTLLHLWPWLNHENQKILEELSISY